MIDAARENDASKDARRPYALIVEVLLRCGLRLGECLGLQFRDIDFAESVLQVQRSLEPSRWFEVPRRAPHKGAFSLSKKDGLTKTANQRPSEGQRFESKMAKMRAVRM